MSFKYLEQCLAQSSHIIDEMVVITVVYIH